MLYLTPTCFYSPEKYCEKKQNGDWFHFCPVVNDLREHGMQAFLDVLSTCKENNIAQLGLVQAGSKDDMGGDVHMSRTLSIHSEPSCGDVLLKSSGAASNLNNQAHAKCAPNRPNI